MLRKIGSAFGRNPLAGVVLALGVIVLVSALVSPYFLTAYNMTVLARSLAFVGLVTIGQAMLMMMGDLDLSLGAIGGLCGVLSGILMVNLGVPALLALPLAVLAGAACGALNGLLVTALGLPSLVLTIGTAGVYGGLNLVLTKGVAITNIPAFIRPLGTGTLLGVPVPFVIMIAVLLVSTYVTLRTPYGRHIYALGNNLAAAKILGIRVSRTRLVTFTVAGALAGLAGTLMVARLGSAQPSIGDGWVLAPIASAVIGGVATTGGVGTTIGAIVGAAIIAVIQNVIVLFGVSPYWQSMVSGAIVVLAISFDAVMRRYVRKET